MPSPDTATQSQIGVVEQQGRKFSVACRIAFDGIEYVGRLWFTPEGGREGGLPDRAAIPGRSRDEVLEFARRLTPHDLELRHRRALAEKRRFMELRSVTEDILSKIRYLNQIAISVRDGLLDKEGAAQEIELTERQLHDCVKRLRHAAGVES
jgi:hypothetical protein